MDKVKLWCAVYGQGSVFCVKIARDARMSALQEVIAGVLSTQHSRVPPSLLRLYLARKNGEWLKDDDHVKTFLQAGISTKYEEMQPLWMLNDERCFGEGFQPADEEIHVLVQFPRLTTHGLSRDLQLVVDGQHIPITDGACFNPPTLVAFWQALANDRTAFEAGAVIKLPEGTYLLGDETLGSRIYIRHCYPGLWELCQNKINDIEKKTSHLVILGTPGIGKTYFGYAILLLLARAEATVVYESGATEDCILFSRDTVISGSRQAFVSVLDQPTTYYIVDGVKPRYVKAKTILLTWPRYSIWRQFHKMACGVCYMPVWSIEEILECRELMYSDIPEDVVKECFRRWGGVARYVLRYARFECQQSFLDKALGCVDLDRLVKVCCRLDENEAAHHLLHYCVNEKFKDEYFVFASQYVQQKVYNRLYVTNKRKLFEFLAESDDDGARAVLRGLLFEGYVHSVLPQGGTFRVRRLINNNKAGDGNDALIAGDDVSTISFPRSKKIVFNSDSDVLSAANSIYLQPEMKNYESVDAIMKPDILFQVTGARKHPFIQKGIHDVLKLLGDPEALQLYIVLPPDGFANFPYLDSERTRMAMAMPSYMDALNIQLFAMEVKPDSEEKKKTWAGSSETPKQSLKRRHA